MAENTNTSATAGISSAYGTETTSADTTTNSSSTEDTSFSDILTSSLSATSESSNDDLFALFKSFIESYIKAAKQYREEHPGLLARLSKKKKKETTAEDTPAETVTPKTEETPVQEAVAQETVVQETPVQEAVVQETPVQEAVAQETPVQEAAQTVVAAPKTVAEPQLKKDLTEETLAAYPTNAQITAAVNGSYLNLSGSQSYLENGTITNVIPTPTIDKSALTLDLTSQTSAAYPTDDKVTAQVQEADTVALSSSKTYLDSNGTSGKDLATDTLTKTVQKPTELSPALMTYLNQQRA
jgi:hypothetical protein